MLERLAEELWKRGVDVSLAEIRKWVWDEGLENPEAIADALSKAVEGKKEWAVVTVMNQLQYMFPNWSERSQYLEELAEKNVDPIAAIITWRKEPVSPRSAIYRKIDLPKYVESVESPVDFFKGILRYEFGADVDALEERAATVMDEKDVPGFFRLVDIDAPVAPEEFVKRVEKAVEVLATAKEQGLDVREILRKWDELADQGGMRLEKLPAAVKAVAEKAVRERFWEEVARILGENGVRVFTGSVPEDTLGAFYYLGLVGINGNSVDIGEAEAFLEQIAALLRKARAIPMYEITEVAGVIEKMGIDEMKSREQAEAVARIIGSIDKRAARVFVEGDVAETVSTYVRKAVEDEIDEEAIVNAVNEVLSEVYLGSIAGKEEVAQFLEKKLLS